MEHAKWKGKIISASEISEHFDIEHEVRKASRRKELTCPDEECNAIVRYCHGEIRGAYFAHLIHTNCDYDIFDRTDNKYFSALRRKLKEHLIRLGLDVQVEKKVLPHHYAHMVITDNENRVFAVEMGTQKTAANTMEYLSNEYAAEKVPVRWLVVGDTLQMSNEKDLYFIKRYLLNRTDGRDFILLDWRDDKVSQCRWDINRYEYNGRKIRIDNYPELYVEHSDLHSLLFENGKFTLSGFNVRYEQWLKDKEKSFMIRVQELEESRKANEYIHAVRRDYPIVQQSSGIISSYDKRRAEILPLMNQREHSVVDSIGIKWYCCEMCGKIDEEGEFVIMNRNNTGCCRDCMIPKH